MRFQWLKFGAQMSKQPETAGPRCSFLLSGAYLLDIISAPPNLQFISAAMKKVGGLVHKTIMCVLLCTWSDPRIDLA